jgi:hypothetical protein
LVSHGFAGLERRSAGLPDPQPSPLRRYFAPLLIDVLKIKCNYKSRDGDDPVARDEGCASMKKLDLKTLKTVSGGHGSRQGNGLGVGLNLGGLGVGLGLNLGSSSGKSR